MNNKFDQFSDKKEDLGFKMSELNKKMDMILKKIEENNDLKTKIVEPNQNVKVEKSPSMNISMIFDLAFLS